MGHRRGASDTGLPTVQGPDYSDDVSTYCYSNRIPNGVRKPPLRQKERYIDEEEEYGSPSCEGDPFHDADFEIIRSSRPTSPWGSSRRPDVRKFRVKVHASEDTRYIIVGPTIEFEEFEARIREKFGFRLRLRIRMQDDGDMITMVDQEDLDLLMGSARENARRERSAMGKMEVR